MSIDTTSRVFQVLLSEKGRVDAALEALTKRCTRRKLTPVGYEWGKAYSRIEHCNDSPCTGFAGCRGCRRVARISLTLTGPTPKYAGWSFLAALTHVDGETVVRGTGEDVPSQYRTSGPACDHCRIKRERAETYVVRHEDGRTAQVGSTCMADFLGDDSADRLAANATIMFSFFGVAEDAEERGGRSEILTLDEYLPMVAWCVRELGWLSRTAARESGRGIATADTAWTFKFDFMAASKAGASPTADDAKLAADAAVWAEALTDADITASKGDYLHNLRAVARAGYVNPKLAGVAASMITAYQNHLGRERLRAERAARPASDYVGTVDARMTFDATLDFVTGYDTDFGYMVVCKFKTAAGATLVWKSTSAELQRDDVGKRYIVRGTVKAHSEYKGERQTILSRADVSVFDQAAYDASVAEERYKALTAAVKAGTASDADRAELATLKTSRKAASKAASAKVAACMNIETVIAEKHLSYGTRTVVQLVGRENAWLMFDDYHSPTIYFHLNGESHHFSGKDALTKARKFVAEMLAKKAA